jgi:hypothetical protein
MQETLSTSLAGTNTVVAIGHGLAPEDLSMKCLVLSNYYDWEMIEYENHKVLIPRKK